MALQVVKISCRLLFLSTTSYLFQNITKPLLRSFIRKNYLFSLFFSGRKRFAVPRDDDTSVPPTPARIFLARYKVPSPADAQQPVVLDDVVEADENIPVSTCDFA